MCVCCFNFQKAFFGPAKSIPKSDGTNLIFTTHFNQFIDLLILSPFKKKTGSILDAAFEKRLFLMRLTRDMLFSFEANTFLRRKLWKKKGHAADQAVAEPSMQDECQTTINIFCHRNVLIELEFVLRERFRES